MVPYRSLLVPDKLVHRIVFRLRCQSYRYLVVVAGIFETNFEVSNHLLAQRHRPIYKTQRSHRQYTLRMQRIRFKHHHIPLLHHLYPLRNQELINIILLIPLPDLIATFIWLLTDTDALIYAAA